MGFAIGFGLPIAACVVGIWLMAGRASAALARSIAIALLPGIAAAAVVTYLAHDNSVFKFYASSLRGSLFSGFLSLGAFMFSLKTFILVNMKTGVYDNDRYRQRVENARTAAPNTPIKVYGSLERLRSLLFWSILTSLFTAVLQMTLGLVDSQVTVAITLGAVGVSLGFLGQALFHINANLKMWFEFLEQDVDAKRATQAEAQAKIDDEE